MFEPHPYRAPLASPLRTELLGARVLALEEADSTNLVALRIEGHGVVVVADRQTAGRGRHGKSWDSKAGLGLWFSVGFEGAIDGLGFAAALAVRDALAPRCAVTVKWPNDLLIDGKKVCGILVENKCNRTALGIGINVRHQPADFPEEVRAIATSLEYATGQSWDRDELLAEIITLLDRRVMVLLRGGYEAIRSEWAVACNLKGRLVQFEGTEAVVAEIDGDGALIVTLPGGNRRLMAGEVKLVQGA